jgi:hypothetical protein
VLQKFFQLIGIVTILALTYIHMQMKIIELAYQGKVKESKVQRLKETNEQLTYDLLMKKSAANIGEVVLNDSSSMQFVDPNNVIRVATPRVLMDSDSPHNASSLSWVSMQPDNAYAVTIDVF